MHQPPEQPVYLPPPLYPWRIALTSLFTTCMVGGLVLGVKPLQVLGVNIAGGILIFPLTYGIAVVTAEVYGFATAERLIYLGLLNLVLFIGAFEVVLNAPPATYWPYNAQYHMIYGAEPRLIVTVILAYVVGQTAAVRGYRALARLRTGRLLYTRVFLAPCVAQIVTAAVSIPLAYTGRYSTSIEAHALLTQIEYALIQSVVAAPFIWSAILLFRRLETPHPDVDDDLRLSV